MNELIEKIKKLKLLTELPEINTIDHNILFIAIIIAERYELLNNYNLNLHIDNDLSTIKLVETLLEDEDRLYFSNRNNFQFTKDQKDKIFKIALEITKTKHIYSLPLFINYLFQDDKEIEEYISDNEEIFKTLLKERTNNIPYSLKDKQNFIKLILGNNYISLISNLDNYSVENLKRLVILIKSGTKLSHIECNLQFADKLFTIKEYLKPEEFYTLLKTLVVKEYYDGKLRRNNEISFEILVENNIDYLLNTISIEQYLPKCLAESIIFRNECIKRNRYDLAVQCLLPKEFLTDENIAKNYCKELNINTKLYEKIKNYLTKYYNRNNNIFNSLIATSLKYKIFNIKEEHLERFINDTEIQLNLAKLNNKELKIINLILEQYDYTEYDITPMISNIIINIKDYNELINNITLEEINNDQLKKLISILSISNNQFNIKTIDDLKNYRNKKQEYIEKHIIEDNINFLKDSILKYIFNINLKEGTYINYKFCYDSENINMLDKLKDSELPKTAYKYLTIINKITESQSKEDLIEIYSYYKDNNIYDLEIPLEAYLRSIYTNLYSESLYKIDNTKKEEKQPSIKRKISYNGNEVDICIPRDDFKFMIHCLGTCYKTNESTDINYQEDWEYFPQIQDHAVACSYIDNNKLYAIRAEGIIAYGFDNLEGASLIAMGDSDIDSIGYYSCAYESSKKLMELNRDRAKFFVPSLILESKKRGYNEIVIERRNNPKLKEQAFKRTPNYIIMSVDSLDKENLITLDELFNKILSFLTTSDRIEIAKTNDKQAIEKILKKYKDPIFALAEKSNIKPIVLLKEYIEQIMKSKFYDNSLKAATEFNIPLIIIDKEYYFFKALKDSNAYDDETKNQITEFYNKASHYIKRELYEHIVKGKDIESIINEKKSEQSFTISV